MKRNIVVVGTSAGGLDALQRLVTQLPRDFDASLFIVQHLAQTARGHLVDLLQHATPLPVRWAGQGDSVESGHIVVARPGLHLLFADDHVVLDAGARENHSRPSINRLFRSAAAHYGSRTIGVLMTGMLDDGVSGLGAIRAAGGIAIVQDPADAAFPDLPRAALAAVGADHVLPVGEIGRTIVAMTRASAREITPPKEICIEAKLDQSAAPHAIEQLGHLGPQTPLSCPRCHGPMWKVGDESTRHYRCYLGHTASAREVLADTCEELETALWSAVRALYERAEILNSLETDSQQLGHDVAAREYAVRAAKIREQAKLAHDFMLKVVSETAEEAS